MASLTHEQERALLFDQAQTQVVQASRQISEEDIRHMRNMINENNQMSQAIINHLLLKQEGNVSAQNKLLLTAELSTSKLDEIKSNTTIIKDTTHDLSEGQTTVKRALGDIKGDIEKLNQNLMNHYESNIKSQSNILKKLVSIIIFIFLMLYNVLMMYYSVASNSVIAINL